MLPATSADVHLLQSTVNGPVRLDGTTRSAVLVGTTISGPLACSSNTATPVNLEAPNHVTGPRAGQCALL